MKVAVYLLVVVILFAVLVVLYGYSLPKAHSVSRAIDLPADPQRVFDAISRFSNYPTWRSSVSRVDLQADSNGKARFIEHSGRDAILYEVEFRDSPHRLVIRIADPSLPYGGTWTHEVMDSELGSQLRTTEDGLIFNPLFRVVSRHFIGYTKTIDEFHADVAKLFGPAH